MTLLDPAGKNLMVGKDWTLTSSTWKWKCLWKIKQKVYLVGSGVHLGDDDVLVVGILLSELVPGGGELFAVSAPGGVELNEDVLGVVAGNL